MIHTIYLTVIGILALTIVIMRLLLDSKNIAIEYFRNEMEYLKGRYEDTLERVKELEKEEKENPIDELFNTAFKIFGKIETDLGIKQSSNKTLKQQLDEAIENEDYERAEEIKRIMDKNKES